MGMSSGGDDQGMMAEINVTPFVDVMLVLLIIFMVTTPMIVLENQLNKIEVDVPPADAEPLTEVTEDQLVLSIDEEGKTWIAETEVSIDELEQKLTALVKDNPDKQVFLNADGVVPYARVAEVMAICSRAGVEGLGMITEPEAE
jgi:biopolymer transport protein TolR